MQESQERREDKTAEQKERKGKRERAWYRLSEKEIFAALSSQREGLSEKEAQLRLERDGENVLQMTKRKSALRVFLEQFQDLLVLILLASAAISAFSGSGESALVIVAALTINGLLGTLQHRKAEKSLKSLQALSAPTAKVLREGKLCQIPTAKVVVGDLLLLESGDLAAADARIVSCHRLRTDESSLTGESEHVEKTERTLTGQIEIADQKNMVFSGSLIAAGRAEAVVTATGMDTEIGRIARLMSESKEKRTPLQQSLDDFSGKLAVWIVLICCVVFLLEVYRGVGLLPSLMFAVALAVAAIPEALSSIVTIVQAMGTQKMAKEQAIIKDLKAVESLGCVSVICSDKTGTLTQNRMSVKYLYGNRKILPLSQLSPYPTYAKRLLEAVFLNNDAVRQGERYLGEPTETALLALEEHLNENEDTKKVWKHQGQEGLAAEVRRLAGERLFELPFDSQRKKMSVCYRLEGERILFVKGAPESVIKSCERLWTEAGESAFGRGERERTLVQNESWSKQGLRVLAFACRKLAESEQAESEGLEENLTFLGLAAMMDAPRPESKAAVLRAKQAGIRTVMITGDQKMTAQAIAEKIGILTENSRAVSGEELNRMSETQLLQELPHISVYARVTPEHKIRIVDAFQKNGQITAMTGDGVNDAPALKKADIGIAMGQMGTEVAKDAASMILADDNFSTIIKAVANGRNVYRNIKHAIQFLLSGNMAGILCVLYTSIKDLPLPFAPVHLLFINLVTDSLPALAIGMEAAEEDLLAQPPRDPRQGILSGAFLREVGIQGSLLAVCTLLAYQTGLLSGGIEEASTMAFATLTLARLFHGFNCRSRHSLFRIGFSGNPYSLGAFVVGMGLLLAVLFVPVLQSLFAVAALTRRQLLTIAIFAALPTALIQGAKAFRESLT
ncbi:MAG: cation-translocating P-type ATPase [bacterium]|nr:cation-translocating P-type ATPase [bacterium]